MNFIAHNVMLRVLNSKHRAFIGRFASIMVDSSPRAEDSFHTAWLVSGNNAVVGKQGLLFVLRRSDYTLQCDGAIIIPCIS